MKIVSMTALFLLTAGVTNLAMAGSGVADRYNEARSYPATSATTRSAQALCQQHAQLHRQMSAAHHQAMDKQARHDGEDKS